MENKHIITKWKIPPRIKVLEALGAIGDERIQINGNEAKVYSSSRNKFYSVEYDKKTNTISSNDNGSYWKGYLGYPAIAYLMKIGELPVNLQFCEQLKDIKWKDINQKFKNDFEKTEKTIMDLLKKRGENVEELENFIEEILEKLIELSLQKPKNIPKPPEGH